MAAKKKSVIRSSPKSPKNTYSVSIFHNGKNYSGTEKAYSEKQAIVVFCIKNKLIKDYKKIKNKSAKKK